MEKKESEEKHIWNVKCVKGMPANSEAVLVYRLAPFSVKIYLIDFKVK